jgi:spoIIIJ-associated protein
VEWVEKTGKTVDEAKERALDQLGVSEADAELVVLAEPKRALFGRVRGEARVRARVRPAEPRPKRPRRPRERSRSPESGPGGTGGPGRGEGRRVAGARRPGSVPARLADGTGQAGRSAQAVEGSGSTPTSRRRRRRSEGANGQERSGTPGAPQRAGSPGGEAAVPPGGSTRNGQDRPVREESTVADGVTLQEQAAVAKEFLEGLLDRYGLEASIEVRELDEETVELAADGEGLGILVGPKGATVAALQDVTRTVVQRQFPSRTDRILVDVAGYRERRIAALQRFTRQVASEVLENGSERALEPMTAADRKVVHDTVAEIGGVASSSQGEDPHRFVVIAPAD